MTRSRRRKLVRMAVAEGARAIVTALPLASIVIASMRVASAQDAQVSSTAELEEVIVTAQKREENLQNVPVSVEALNSAKLEELHIQNFNDYVKFLPSVSTQSVGPGFSRVYIRGVSSDANQSHSGPLPTVGTYLDEQPVTTIQGTLDVHIYDIARVEVLAGPQGTLYGASSEAGTLRIITNKPDPKGFDAGYNLEGNTVAHGDEGYVAEGFVNIPLSSNAAVRLVGWSEHDAGFIDNVPGTRTYPTSGICIANTNPPPAGCISTPSLARKNFNGVDTAGARAALKLDLDDSWTITPVVMGQGMKTSGVFGYDPTLGDLNVTRYYPDKTRDNWVDAALTVEGKIGNWDAVYAGAFLKRDELIDSDYTDYTVAYAAYDHYVTNSAGNLANPSMTDVLSYHYKKQSHELRVSSPKEKPLRFVGGLFLQRQQEHIEEQYNIDDASPTLTVPGWPGTWFLLDQERIDRDAAVFGELSYDLTSKFTATAGIRYFKVKNTNNGFVGLSQAVDDLEGITLGQASCFEPGISGAPCTNVDKRVDEKGHTPKVNLSYHIDDQRMVYATFARGFRPGGINRLAGVPPFKSDYLTSYEIGWKTSWADNRIRFNGAIFEEDWKDFQFAFVGSNGLSQFANAGQARIRGVESDINWAATEKLVLSTGVSLLDPKLTENYCGTLDASGAPITDCASPLAPAGTQLPGTSKFKGNVTARYRFHLGTYDAHLQGAYVYQSGEWPDLRLKERGILGRESPYGVAELSTGLARGNYSLELFVNNLFDKRAQLTRYSECAPASCGPFATYIVPNQPRTVGVRFGQQF